MSKGSLIRLAVTATILTATLVASRSMGERTAEELSRPLETIPFSLDCWEGQDNPRLNDATESVLKADSYLTRSYACGERSLSFFMAYYSLQKAGESMHSPRHCLPGSGWEIWNYEELETTAPNGETVAINKFYLQHGRQRTIAYYWYQSRSRIVANEYLGKFCLVWDTVLRGNTEGSIVRVIVEDNETADEIVKTFIPRMIGEIAAVMPGDSRFKGTLNASR